MSRVRDAAAWVFRRVSPELYEYRHLLFGLVKNSLKGKYNNSALGVLWHIINPVMQIVVYALVFTMLLGRTIENYWAYLSVGVFAYNFFASSLNSGTSSIVARRGMVTKMYFPRAILVLADVTVHLITFVISYAVLICLIAALGFLPNPILLLLVPVVILIEAVFITGAALAFSAVNVFYRDAAYGMHIITMLMMFMTPVFYEAPSEGLVHYVLMVNPMAYYVGALHDLIYYGVLPGAVDMLIGLAAALAALAIGMHVFKSLERVFPEKL